MNFGTLSLILFTSKFFRWKGAQDLGLRISTLFNFVSSDLIGGKTMEVIWAPIGGNIVGASVPNQVF